MIELFTSETPNGWKASITLEEMEIEYKVRHIHLSRHEQKEDWYTAMNPNGRIPTMIDHDNDGFVVFDSSAMMVYLAEKTGLLMPNDVNERSRVIQWLFFQSSGIGPMMGQANVFYRYFPEKIQPAIDRYQREVRRLLEVLDKHLADKEYIAGDYSIADIANWSWAHIYDWSGVSADRLDNFNRWVKLVGDRPAVKRGRAIPEPTDLGDLDDQTLVAGKKILV